MTKPVGESTSLPENPALPPQPGGVLGESQLAKSEARTDWVILLGCSAVLLAAALLRLNSESRVAAGGWQLPGLCWFRNATGVDCPGCGLTRGFVALAHGHPRHAWDFNPASLLWFVAVAAQIPWRAYRIWRRKQNGTEAFTQTPRWSAGVILLTVLGLSLIVQWLLRLNHWL